MAKTFKMIMQTNEDPTVNKKQIKVLIVISSSKTFKDVLELIQSVLLFFYILKSPWAQALGTTGLSVVRDSPFCYVVGCGAVVIC